MRFIQFSQAHIIVKKVCFPVPAPSGMEKSCSNTELIGTVSSHSSREDWQDVQVCQQLEEFLENIFNINQINLGTTSDITRNQLPTTS